MLTNVIFSNRLLAGVPTYRYLYSGNFSNVSPLPWMGAFHSCKSIAPIVSRARETDNASS